MIKTKKFVESHSALFKFGSRVLGLVVFKIPSLSLHKREEDNENNKESINNDGKGLLFHAEELAFAQSISSASSSPSSFNNFLAGRMALRRALLLAGAGPFETPILRDSWKAPLLPTHLRGSITHKDELAAAVGGVAVFAETNDFRVGLDLERTSSVSNHRSLALRILTDSERTRLGNISTTGLEIGRTGEHGKGAGGGVSISEEVLLRFSLKEAAFKALHPFLKRHIGFKEVEVEPRGDGSASVSIVHGHATVGAADESGGERDRNIDNNGSKILKLEGKWRRILGDRYFLSIVKVEAEIC